MIEVAETIVQYYTEREMNNRERLTYKRLKDNFKYEVSASGKIRRVGKVYPLTPRRNIRYDEIRHKNYTKAIEDKEYYRIFDTNGKPYHVTGKEEAEKVWLK